jgi:hypothetical protein
MSFRSTALTCALLWVAMACGADESAPSSRGPGGKADDPGGERCFFGTTYWDRLDSGELAETATESYGDVSEFPLGPEVQDLLVEQVLLAGRRSISDEYTSVAEVFAGSEGSEVTVVALSASHERTFRAVRFYPGGNPYGAIFRGGTLEIVAIFADDDFVDCLEPTSPELEGGGCLFGESYWDGLDAGDVEETGTATYYDEADLPFEAVLGPSLAALQLVEAARVSTGEEFGSAAEVFEASEAHEVHVSELTGTEEGRAFRAFRAFRFFPGGNPYGAIFRNDTLEVAAAFADDDITQCAEAW